MARKPKKSEETKADAAKAEEVLTSADDDLNAEQVTDSNADQESHSQCGAQLSAARVAQGLTTNDIAKQLRLSQTQIEALEEDRFSQLPEATIVKGFIRNYAKVLKISSGPLLVAYAEMVPEKEHYSFVLGPGINMKITEHQKSNKTRYFLFAASLLFVIGAWVFYQNYIQKPSPVSPVPEIVDTLPELALPLSERVVESSATSESLDMPKSASEPAVIELSSAGSASPDAQDDDKLEEAVLDNAETEEAVTEDIAETLTDAIESSPPVQGKTRLKFSATQETWLSVINVSGKEVYNKILYAGNQEVVDIWQPSMVVVGNAHGATLIVDGKPIDLAPYTRVNVARVRLNR